MSVDPISGSDIAPIPEPAPPATDTGGAAAGTVADLADTLVNVANPSSGPDTRPTDGAVLRYGKVTAVGTGGNILKAQTDATGTAWVSYDVSYAAQVGDLVYLITQGPVVHIAGQLGGTQPTPPPVGVIHPYAGATAPMGWLICNGAAVSRTTYAQLFAVCGTTFGAGDGSTTFNIPNLVDRMPTGSGSLFARGETGGAETRTLTVANLPGHTHTINHDHVNDPHTHAIDHDHTQDPHTHSGAAHTHSYTGAGSQTIVQGTSGGSATLADNTSGTTGSAGGGTTGSATPNVVAFHGSSGSATNNTLTYSGSSGSAGSGTAVNVMSPYLGLQFILRALP